MGDRGRVGRTAEELWLSRVPSECPISVPTETTCKVAGGGVSRQSSLELLHPQVCPHMGQARARAGGWGVGGWSVVCTSE